MLARQAAFGGDVFRGDDHMDAIALPSSERDRRNEKPVQVGGYYAENFKFNVSTSFFCYSPKLEELEESFTW